MFTHTAQHPIAAAEADVQTTAINMPYPHWVTESFASYALAKITLFTKILSYLFHVKIDFVSNDNKRKVIGVARAGLYEELVAPAIERTERGGFRHIVDKDAAVSATVERNSETLEPLLTRCVPYLNHTVPNNANTTYQYDDDNFYNVH